MAHLSLTAIEHYLNQSGGSMFNGIPLPPTINKSTLVNTILERAIDFETIYPDADYLKFSVPLFFKRHLQTFTKWAEALEIEYNPLENYDRHEQFENSGNVTGKADATSTNTGKVTAYDSETLKTNDEQSNVDHSDSEGHTAGRGTSHIHGNIGVTTSQQMLQAELDVRRFNIYEQITDLFVEHFCLLVY